MATEDEQKLIPRLKNKCNTTEQSEQCCCKKEDSTQNSYYLQDINPCNKEESFVSDMTNTDESRRLWYFSVSPIFDNNLISVTKNKTYDS